MTACSVGRTLRPDADSFKSQPSVRTDPTTNLLARFDHELKENPMPYVNVRITKDGVTKEQKARIVAENDPHPHRRAGEEAGAHPRRH